MLSDTKKVIDNYKELAPFPDVKPNSMKKAWKRVNWEPQNIRDLRDRISTNIVMLNAFSGRAVQSSVARLMQHDERRQIGAILEWLSSVNYATQQSDCLSRRQLGTGKWLLESMEFQKLVKEPKQTLFCQGIPGAGKTILTSIVIDHLDTAYGNDENVALAYIYFNFRRSHEQRMEDVLAGLLKQLVQGQSSLPDPVKVLYNQCYSSGRRPKLSELSKALRNVISRYSKVFIVVDALDEFWSTDMSHDLFLSEIFDLQTRFNIGFFATARPIPEIMTRFRGLSSLEITASHQDVKKYIQGNIYRLPRFVRRNSKLQEDIVQVITGVVDGM